MIRATLGRLRVPGAVLLLLFLAASSYAADPPLFVCEPDCKCDAETRANCRACVWLTAANVPDIYAVRFVASVQQNGEWKEHDIVEGRSGPVAIEDEWTLVTMEVRRRISWKRVCWKLFRKKCATCKLEHANYERQE